MGCFPTVLDVYWIKFILNVHGCKWKQNIYNILPFNNSIKRIIIELLKPELNYREDYFPQYNIPFKCPNLKPIETPICKKCIKLYINNPITNKPILWFGISSNEWLHRYG